MKSSVLALLAGASTAFAHYNFNALIVNGNVTDEYVYVRKNTNSNSPVTDVTSDDFRCNVGGMASGPTTQTHDVAPGDQLGFTIVSAIGHPGPLQVYMSKATDTASSYDGSGDWFKVYELSTSTINSQGLQWATNGLTNFTFTLPTETPAGEYLLRVEQIALHGAQTVGGAQFYISCAQIKVSGSGSGTPTDTAKIPGVYTGTEPGIEINIYYPVPTNYTMPGPAVWPVNQEDHTANLLGQTSDGDGTPSAGEASSAVSSAAIVSSTAAAVSSSAVAPVATSSSVASSSAVITSVAAVATSSPSSTLALSTTVVAAASSSSAAAALSSAVAPLYSQISNLTTAIPSGFLTSAIPTALPLPTGGAVNGSGDLPPVPPAGLPEGMTLKDLLDWLMFMLEGMMKGGRRHHARSLRNE